MKPKALILHAAGINRDVDVAFALELAGAEPSIAHVNHVRKNPALITEAAMLVIPGGFSYADALGAGRLFALDIASFFRDEVAAFVDSGKPVLGICNGFQTLVKAGILPGTLPGSDGRLESRNVTLTDNLQGLFECRWVSLIPESSRCVWTAGLSERIACPVAHGEGRFVARDESILAAIEAQGLVALRYAKAGGILAGGEYPANPNGSVADIAGICNSRGNVLGLMPHPEDNVITGKGAKAYLGGKPGGGLDLLKMGVRYAMQS